MPINFDESLTSLSQWAFGSPFLNQILGNSVLLSTVISLIVLLLIMFIYPAKQGTGPSVLFQIFIYVFLSTNLLIMLHDGITKYKKQTSDDITFGGDSSMECLIPTVLVSPNMGNTRMVNDTSSDVNNSGNNTVDGNSDERANNLSDLFAPRGCAGGPVVDDYKQNPFS